MVGLADSAARKTTSSLRSCEKRTATNELGISLSELAKRPDPFFLPNLLDGFEESKYGRFANDIRKLCELKRKILYGARSCPLNGEEKKDTTQENLAKSTPIIIIDSDDELPEIVANDSVSNSATDRNAKDKARGKRVMLESDDDDDDVIFLEEDHCTVAADANLGSNNEQNSSPNFGFDSSEINEESEIHAADDGFARMSDDDGIKGDNWADNAMSPQNDIAEDSSDEQVEVREEDLWAQMAFVLESTKPTASNPPVQQAEEKVEDCEHSFIYKDDIGEVCRVCGVVKTPVESIIEVVFNKPKRLRRSYMYEPENIKKGESSYMYSGSQSSQANSLETKISVHPKHGRQMRPHQIQGFNFLCDNLVTDGSGGCILAHTPGSGKTFLVISFIQSFMALYPHAKPLIVLPKGIIETWKREFTLWSVEDFPLLDFYSSKAESRAQQLDVLRKWIEQRSILFLGYKQFSSVIVDIKNKSYAATECQRILLKAPTLLILDEGHTSRNETTDVLTSLARVETPRKVVLTGTLFQNKVREVFNILNLVRPKFLNLPSSQEIARRIVSKIGRKSVWNPVSFCDAVENTLKHHDDSSVKASVIKDLREMTRTVLHYHKADFRGELPGLIEFTVMLNLSKPQTDEIEMVRTMRNFKQMSAGSALYMHPKLLAYVDQNQLDGEKTLGFDNDKIDEMLENIKVEDGVKMKFFLNLLNLCESKREKLLVFSHFVLPLKTLERLLSETKGWSLGKDMFIITGDSSNEERECSKERFNTSPDAKVLFGSIKACGEGISLVGASRVLILDVHLNPSVTQQAVARAYRPGQKKKVYAYRLVAADSPEESDYKTCSDKEFISKMWFEWNLGRWGRGDFELMRAVEVDDCDDEFLETPKLREDIKALYMR